MSDIALIESDDDTDLPIAKVSFASVGLFFPVVVSGYGDKKENDERRGHGFTYAWVKAMPHYEQYWGLDSKTIEGPLTLMQPGDSGSPAFIQVQGVYSVVGVNSWGVQKLKINESSEPRQITFATRMDKDAGTPRVKDWICSIVRLDGC